MLIYAVYKWSADRLPPFPLVCTNRQIVYARPSGVNICSLQIEHRSAASFSIGAIGTNGSIGEGFLTIGICLCVLDMCDENTFITRQKCERFVFTAV